MNYQQKIAGTAITASGKWDQIDGIAGTEIDGWILMSRIEEVWTQKRIISDMEVKRFFPKPARFAAEIKKEKLAEEERRKQIEGAREACRKGKRFKELAEQKLLMNSGKTREKQSTADLQAEVKSASADFSRLQNALAKLQSASQTASIERDKIQDAYNNACVPLLELLEDVDEQVAEDFAASYNPLGTSLQVLMSANRRWVLIYFGTGLFSKYLITWNISAFVSPLRERTLLSLDDLIGSLLSSSEKELDTFPKFGGLTKIIEKSDEDKDQKLNKMKHQLFPMLSRLVESIKKLLTQPVNGNSGEQDPHVPANLGQKALTELRPIQPGSLDFLADTLKVIGYGEGPITHALVGKLGDHDVEMEKSAKNWETDDILKLWRALPRRQPPDKAREALARVLAERITKSGGRDKVLEFLADYQTLMDQNGMDKTAPHPLYYMILSRKSRGAIATLIDACEDDTLLNCTDWTVDKGAYDPRVWQTLLDGLTDRLTLKFHRDIYDADGFDQSRRIVENLKEMIECGKLPIEMREAYRWRLVSLVREALCRAETATKDQGTETGGAARFIGWVNNDFLSHASFVQNNPQMQSMFTPATTIGKE